MDMSVLVLDHNTLSYIHSGIRKVAFLNEVTEFYSPAMSQHFNKIGWGDMDKEATRLIKSWLTLNERSYFERYQNEPHEYTAELWHWSRHKPITAVQLYKHLECLIYNIELGGGAEDVKLLRAWIGDLEKSIIHNMLEYQAANWS